MPTHALVRKNISAIANKNGKKAAPSNKVYLLITPLIYFVAITFLSLLFAAFLKKLDDPSAYTGMLALCANAIAAFISSFVLSKKLGWSALVCALYFFFVTCIISVIASLILDGNDTAIYKALLMRSPLLAASVMGSFFGKANKRRSSHSHSRYRKKY